MMPISPYPFRLPLTVSDVKSPQGLPDLFPDAGWMEADEAGQGLSYRFEPGQLLGASHLTCDVLLEGTHGAAFAIALQEGEGGPCYLCHFAFLPQCQARIRLPLASVDQNRWLFPREGAWLKVIVQGDRVDLRKVDRAVFSCYRKGPDVVRWCMTPLTAVDQEPPLLNNPLMPRGPLLDEMGQSTLTGWPGKVPNVRTLVSGLRERRAKAADAEWPAGFSSYGGCADLRFPASGFFRTHHDGQRWWLVDPGGHAFWSAGLDCVRPGVVAQVEGLEQGLIWDPQGEPAYATACYESKGNRQVDYQLCNLIRAFGPEQYLEDWKAIALADLKHFGFNTMANWSDWPTASAAGFPYVRPLQWPVDCLLSAPRIFRDFPDPFDPRFEQEAEAYAGQLVETLEDPALIGYFLMNEPNWGFAGMPPAEGMLYQTEGGAARRGLASFLREKYDPNALEAQWGSGVDFEALAVGRWTKPINPNARRDLEAYSQRLVEKLFSVLSTACKKVDPNHLNLGARYHRVPPDWAIPGMKVFDVFSINCYRETVDPALTEVCKELRMPALIGEWHFGALDVGLPATGIGHVRTQADRGRAFRIYTEDAAAQPWCVGTHYFTYMDQSALGRGDGENYNIGLVDIAMQPYTDLAAAARLSHERLYAIARGQTPPTEDRPEYLPRLFY